MAAGQLCFCAGNCHLMITTVIWLPCLHRSSQSSLEGAWSLSIQAPIHLACVVPPGCAGAALLLNKHRWELCELEQH